jgi:CDP-glycerol glycerophosphotransferase
MKKNFVVIGTMSGKYFGGNSKTIYFYLLKNYPQIKVTWITKNQKVYHQLKAANLPVVKSNSIMGIITLWQAKVGVVTNELRDIALTPFLVLPTLKLVSLRHGRSVKKVRFAREKHRLALKESWERRYENKLITYVISTSDFVSKIQEKCLLVGKEKHLVTGYPRNDIFFDPSRKRIIIYSKKITSVLYAPTWRHGRNPTTFFPFKDFKHQELISFLVKNKIKLYLRPHKNDLIKFPKAVIFLKRLAQASKNIFLVTHDNYPDINELLPDFDILISDYSAIYHDWLLLDKPLLFIPYDYEDFKTQNGFLYDYKKLLPGPIINSSQQLYKEMSHLIRGKDQFKQKRLKLKKLIHKFEDGRASERVAAIINKLVKK